MFYEVSKHQLHRYADFGLAFVKLGEEARVDLEALTFEGGKAARFRQALRYLEKHDAAFRLIDRAAVPDILPQLRIVSDDWLREKAAAEKGFSLGFFNPDYLSRFPVAVVERGGEIVAFASIWASADRSELSADLMRFRSDAPKETMDALFVHLLQWGKTEHYRWFSLGMAPLSGFERSPMAPLWNRFGAFIFEHVGGLYNFQGLRAFKEKFRPEWEPRYCVYLADRASPTFSRMSRRSSPAATAGFAEMMLGLDLDGAPRGHVCRPRNARGGNDLRRAGAIRHLRVLTSNGLDHPFLEVGRPE